MKASKVYPDNQGKFLNPCLVAKKLVDAYRGAIRDALDRAETPPDQVERVLGNIAMSAGADTYCIDPQFWFTLRPEFQTSRLTWGELAKELKIDQSVQQAFERYFASRALHPYKHQEEAARSILNRKPTIIATGTGSGKTEAFLFPLLQLCLEQKQKEKTLGRAPGVKAMIVYPRNALAEDQLVRINELKDLVNKALADRGHTENALTLAKYVGDTPDEERSTLEKEPPDILITNHVMLERILTRAERHRLRGRQSLQAIVFDEIHTFNGNTGADVAWLIQRLRTEAGTNPVLIGASATLQRSGGIFPEEDERALHEFMAGIFFTPAEEISLILPQTIDLKLSSDDEFPEPEWEGLRWSDSLGDFREIASALLGQTGCSEIDDSSRKDLTLETLRTSLEKHSLVKAWWRALRNLDPNPQKPSIALTFEELKKIARDTYQEFHQRQPRDATALTWATLSCINTANYLATREADKGQRRPWMNLVVHVVLRNGQGNLKRCLTCRRYQIALTEQCHYCGQMSFDVARDDVRWLLARIPYPRRVLQPLNWLNKDKKGLLVRVGFISEIEKRPEESMRVRLEATSAGRDSILNFEHHPEGELILAAPGWHSPNNVSSDIAKANERRSNYDYLILLAREIMQIKTRDPRLLVFGDARSRVAIADYELREAFAHGYLLGRARQLKPGHPVSLSDVYGHLRLQLKPEFEQSESPYLLELSKAFDEWFSVLCATSPYSYPEHDGLLTLLNEKQLEEVHPAAAAIAKAFMHVGAVAYPDGHRPPDGQQRILFEYDYANKTEQRFLVFKEFSGIHGHGRFYRLTEKGQIFKNLIEEWGTEALEEAAESLVRKGMACSHNGLLPDGIKCFQLCCHVVALTPESKRHPSIPAYWATGVHSSETHQERRRDYQRDFATPGSNLSTLCATSTLELGIDIGDLLDHILLFGIPPRPSNYTQRVGRAGRGSSAWYALAVTWCLDSRPHDIFYFYRPAELREMLGGIVRPPSIDPKRPEIARRHLFAAVVADYLDKRDSVDQLLLRLREDPVTVLEKELSPELMDLFIHECNLEPVEEINEYLLPELEKLLRNHPDNDSERLKEWFNSPASPSYGFRHDEVELMNGYGGGKDAKDDVISTRPPEQAVQMWFPGDAVATARGFYRIKRGVDHTAKLGESDSGLNFEKYTHFGVEREEGLVCRSELRVQYDISVKLEGQPLALHDPEQWGWLGVRFIPQAELTMVNRGPRLAILDNEKEALRPWGFSTRCNALIVFFDENLIPPGSIEDASLTAAIVHAVQEWAHIRDSDLTFLGDLTSSNSPLEEGQLGFGLADVGHLGTVSFEKIAKSFPQILQKALDRISECSCRGRNTDGCPRCLRTRTTSWHTVGASAKVASSILRALLEKSEQWAPPLPDPESSFRKNETIMNINFKHSSFMWETPVDQGTVAHRRGQFMDGLCDAFEQALKTIPYDRPIRLDSNRKEVRHLLTGRRVEDPSPRQVQAIFSSLRVPEVLDSQA